MMMMMTATRMTETKISSMTMMTGPKMIAMTMMMISKILKMNALPMTANCLKMAVLQISSMKTGSYSKTTRIGYNFDSKKSCLPNWEICCGSLSSETKTNSVLTNSTKRSAARSPVLNSSLKRLRRSSERCSTTNLKSSRIREIRLYSMHRFAAARYMNGRSSPK